MRLVVEFASGASLAKALEELEASGGMLVAVEDRGLAPGASIELRVVAPAGSADLHGSVLQALAGHGLAIQFDATHAALAPLADSDGSVEKPSSRWDDGAAAAEPEPSPAAEPSRAPRATDIPLRERVKAATKAEKIQMALHGSKPERNLLIRDRDKSIHQYVIRNPRIGLDEVATIAKMSSVAPDVLKHICGKREWFQRPEVAAGLVRNPKLSPVLAKKMLNFVSAQELRQLAKGAGVRELIAQEARRRLFRNK